MKLEYAILGRRAELVGGVAHIEYAGWDTYYLRSFPSHVPGILVMRFNVGNFEMGFDHEVLIKVLDANDRPIGTDAARYMLRPQLRRREEGEERPPEFWNNSINLLYDLEGTKEYFEDHVSEVPAVVIPNPGYYNLVIDLDGEEVRRIPFRCLLPTPELLEQDAKFRA